MRSAQGKPAEQGFLRLCVSLCKGVVQHLARVHDVTNKAVKGRSVKPNKELIGHVRFKEILQLS